MAGSCDYDYPVLDVGIDVAGRRCRAKAIAGRILATGQTEIRHLQATNTDRAGDILTMVSMGEE